MDNYFYDINFELYRQYNNGVKPDELAALYDLEVAEVIYRVSAFQKQVQLHQAKVDAKEAFEESEEIAASGFKPTELKPHSALGAWHDTLELAYEKIVDYLNKNNREFMKITVPNVFPKVVNFLIKANQVARVLY